MTEPSALARLVQAHNEWKSYSEQTPATATAYHALRDLAPDLAALVEQAREALETFHPAELRLTDACQCDGCQLRLSWLAVYAELETKVAPEKEVVR